MDEPLNLPIRFFSVSMSSDTVSGQSDVGFACRGITDDWKIDDQWSSVFREPAYQQAPPNQSNDDDVTMSTYVPIQSPFADFKVI